MIISVCIRHPLDLSTTTSVVGLLNTDEESLLCQRTVQKFDRSISSVPESILLLTSSLLPYSIIQDREVPTTLSYRLGAGLCNNLSPPRLSKGQN
jgi:hypothetical protein